MAWPRPGTGTSPSLSKRTTKRLRISLNGPHLSATTPPKGLMDAVTVDRGPSGPTYRYERRVPDA